jgi:hypothetical protein
MVLLESPPSRVFRSVLEIEIRFGRYAIALPRHCPSLALRRPLSGT